MSKQTERQTDKNKRVVFTLSELEAIINDLCFDDEKHDFEDHIDKLDIVRRFLLIKTLFFNFA